jgi:hypothetical protein
VLLYVISIIVKPELLVLRIGFHTTLLLIFLGVIYLVEKPGLSIIRKK